MMRAACILHGDHDHDVLYRLLGHGRYIYIYILGKKKILYV